MASDPRSAVTEPFEAYVVRHEDGVSAGVEALSGRDLPDGDVVIAVSWSSVNYKDGLVTVAGNRVARISPLVPGVDLAGVVVASSSPLFRGGDEVLAHGHDIGVARHGGFAGFASVPADWALPIPEGLTMRRAMAVGTAGFTAALSIDELERHGLTPASGPVVVTGAAGGVGSMAVALLASRGYEVEASTGRVAERPWLLGLGATRVIGRDDLDADSGRVLGPERWAAGVDCVGGATLARVLRCVRYGGAVAASGLTGGSGLETSVFPFITRHVALLGIDSVATPAPRRMEVWEGLARHLDGAAVDALVEEEVSLAGVGGVLARILQGQVRGRALVRVGA